MKKHVFHFLMVSVASMAVLSACEKMHLNEKTAFGEQVNVVVHVTQFEQKTLDARTRSDASDFCTHLCFHVYDDEGIRVSYVNQKQEDDNFGSAAFSLDEGHYYLVVVGHSGSNNPSFNANERVSISGKQMGDTFWCCEELEVGDDRVEKSLVLKRIVSLLRFIPSDAQPENMNQMLFTYKGSRGTFDGLTGYGSTSANQTVDLATSADDTEFEFYMIPSAYDDQISVTVKTYYNEDNGRVNPLTTKEIPDIPVRRNCVTICRGNLFDNQSSSKSVFITVSVDGDWDDDINLSF
jgi:hypothetical protein